MMQLSGALLVTGAVSKPDLSDPEGIIAPFLSANHYRCMASWQNISCWEKPGSS